MLKTTIAAAALLASAQASFAAGDYPAAKIQTMLPGEALTVTDWYKQNVYDPNENKIGDIKDALVDKTGKVVALLDAARAGARESFVLGAGPLRSAKSSHFSASLSSRPLSALVETFCAGILPARA
jgi:hypothetical protein